MLELQPHGFSHIFFSNKGMACGLGAARCFINLVVIRCLGGFGLNWSKPSVSKSNRLEFLY